MGLTNLEALITSLISFYTRRGTSGAITTSSAFVPLSSSSVPAQLVYISNTTGKVLQVSTNNGSSFLNLPDGAVFPFNNIGDLSSVMVKTIDNTGGLQVTYRYEI